MIPKSKSLLLMPHVWGIPLSISNHSPPVRLHETRTNKKQNTALEDQKINLTPKWLCWVLNIHDFLYLKLIALMPQEKDDRFSSPTVNGSLMLNESKKYLPMTIYLITDILNQTLGTLVLARLQQIHSGTIFLGSDSLSQLHQKTNHLGKVHHEDSRTARNKNTSWSCKNKYIFHSTSINLSLHIQQTQLNECQKIEIWKKGDTVLMLLTTYKFILRQDINVSNCNRCE